MIKRLFTGVAVLALAMAVARPAAAAPPKLAAFVTLASGSGWWTNSANLNGNCGLWRGFVVAGTDPAGTIINPVGDWSNGLDVSLPDGTYSFTLLLDGLTGGPWSLDLWFDFTQGNPLHVTETTNGSVTSGLTTIAVNSFSVSSVPGTNRVGACTANPDGLWDSVAHVTFTVSTAVPPDAPPVANAGGSYSVVEHQAVTLNGGGSFDDNSRRPRSALHGRWSPRPPAATVGRW